MWKPTEFVFYKKPSVQSRLHFEAPRLCVCFTDGQFSHHQNHIPVQCKQQLHMRECDKGLTKWQDIPSTSEVSRVTLAAFLLPAGRLSPILSNFSLRERPPFFDLALQNNIYKKGCFFFLLLLMFIVQLLKKQYRLSIVLQTQHMEKKSKEK